jgi:hypothetical protein
MDHRLHATASMAESFYHLFVNRRAYTLQSTRPHPETGRHYYYRPKARDGEAPTRTEPGNSAATPGRRHHARHLCHQSAHAKVQMGGDRRRL